jgi:cleavage and polyadenylation specificity factor subunit 1
MYVYLLDSLNNGLSSQVFAMSSLEKPSYVAEGLGFLPPVLTADYYARRSTTKATITEILAADIGDTTSRSPHLIVSIPTSVPINTTNC